MATLRFDLVSPERRLVSVAATEVVIPAAEGEMTAMAGHLPTIAALRPGVLRATGPGGAQAFAVTGGFAEITGEAVTVLAERAVPLGEASAAMFDALLSEARARAEAPGSDEAAVDRYLAMQALHALVAR